MQEMEGLSLNVAPDTGEDDLDWEEDELENF